MRFLSAIELKVTGNGSKEIKSKCLPWCRVGARNSSSGVIDACQEGGLLRAGSRWQTSSGYSSAGAFLGLGI